MIAPRCILLDCLAVVTGGQVTRAQAFLQRVRRYDADSRVVVLQTSEAPFAWDGDQGLEVRRVSLAPGRFRVIRRMIWQNLRLPDLVKNSGADVYISFSHYLPWTMPASVLTIIGVSNFAPFSKLAWEAEVSLLGRLRLAALKRTILSSARRAHRVIALSAALRALLVELGVEPRKVSVIPNGVEQQSRAGAEEADHQVVERLGVRGNYLLYVSHFYRYKNFERLIQAYAALPQCLTSQYQLVLIGEPYDRYYYSEILRLIEKLNLRERVVVIPGLSKQELRAFYSRTSLFLFPSLAENSPNILLEAMVYGAPVLASRVAPMPEFGGDAIQYVDPLNVEAMTKNMTLLLLDPTALQAMRGRGRARAARFSWDYFTAGVVSLYSSA